MLPVGVEPTHELFLRQPPLPVGLQEHEQEDRAIAQATPMPPDWEGRNRTLKHLIQSQVAFPNLRTSQRMDAEAGFEPASL